MRPQPYPRPSPKAPGSRALWRMRYEATRRTLGDDHPATRAALGRWLEARGAVPQRGSVTPEAIAWHRASTANPGFLNRHHRRAMRQGGIRGYDP